MRAVLQRVSEASVAIDGSIRGAIGPGLLILVGIDPADAPDDVVWLAGKVARMRIFPDDAGRMNRSVVEAGGGCLVVSQFTLFAQTATGNRPSFTAAAKPELAVAFYEAFCARLAVDTGAPVATGEFAADMRVSLVNDGPVTICIDSRRRE